MRQMLAGLALVVAVAFCRVTMSAPPLAGTAPLDWPEEDLSTRMMDGAHRFVEQQIDKARDSRQKFWTRADRVWDERIEANRKRLRTIIGAVDQRAEVRLERFGDEMAPALVAETERYRVFQVRWSVLEGLRAEGLLVEPKGLTTLH